MKQKGEKTRQILKIYSSAMFFLAITILIFFILVQLDTRERIKAEPNGSPCIYARDCDSGNCDYSQSSNGICQPATNYCHSIAVLGVNGCAGLTATGYGSLQESINAVIYRASQDPGTQYSLFCSSGFPQISSQYLDICNCPNLNPTPGQCVWDYCSTCGNPTAKCASGVSPTSTPPGPTPTQPQLKNCKDNCTSDNECGLGGISHQQLVCRDGICVNPNCPTNQQDANCFCQNLTCGTLCGPSNPGHLCSGTDAYGRPLACLLFKNSTTCEFRCQPNINITSVQKCNGNFDESTFTTYDELMSQACTRQIPEHCNDTCDATCNEPYQCYNGRCRDPRWLEESDCNMEYSIQKDAISGDGSYAPAPVTFRIVMRNNSDNTIFNNAPFRDTYNPTQLIFQFAIGYSPQYPNGITLSLIGQAGDLRHDNLASVLGNISPGQTYIIDITFLATTADSGICNTGKWSPNNYGWMMDGACVRIKVNPPDTDL